MTRRIAIFTATRAEYGLLYWLMSGLRDHPDFDLQLIVSGTHLSPEFGLTYRVIERDGFRIDAAVDMLLSSDSPVGVAKSMGLGTIGFADALARLAPDAIVILGDRFEALAMAQAALVMRIPIVHLHGGELTEGAYDDAIRHAITKMASLHFVAAEPYRRRVIQLGEEPSRVFNVGALGLEHLSRTPAMSVEALAGSLDFPLRQPYFLVTYHPVTVADEPPAPTFDALLRALDAFPDHQLLITYPNADNGGRELIAQLKEQAATQPNRICAIASLGQQRYLSAVRHARAVIGNSSSGIIEVPSLGVPTVNIGARQRGRLAAESVIHCEPRVHAIQAAVQKAIEPGFQQACQTATNPYGQGDSAAAIIRILRDAPLSPVKRFYDLG